MSKYINADEQERIMQKNEMIESNDWVEVVRCKDCKFYEPFDNGNFHCGECLNVGYDSPTKTVPKDGFCYEAERKEE